MLFVLLILLLEAFELVVVFLILGLRKLPNFLLFRVDLHCQTILQLLQLPLGIDHFLFSLFYFLSEFIYQSLRRFQLICFFCQIALALCEHTFKLVQLLRVVLEQPFSFFLFLLDFRYNFFFIAHCLIA